MTSKRHIEYKMGSLLRKDLLDNPIELFSKWHEAAVREMGAEADTMVLSTVDTNGKPHSRIVLLKDFSDRGFIFFSNYESAKGHQLKENPSTAILFFWPKLERQVRIEGTVHRTSNSESDTYWSLRSQGSQIATIISPQSRVIPNRSFLEDLYKEFPTNNKMIKRPDHWGGYRIVPDKFEFWQGRAHRLNDRFVYLRTNRQEWDIHRMAP